jgi:hypothetical protein
VAPGATVGVNQGICGDITNSVAANQSEVGYAPRGSLHSYMGYFLPGADTGAHSFGQPVIVYANSSPNAGGSISINTIYNTNGPLQVTAASCSANVVTITTGQNVPTLWGNGDFVIVKGIAGGTNMNTPAAGASISITGATAFTYPSSGCNSSGVTVANANAQPVKGVIPSINAWTGAANTLTSDNLSGTTATASINYINEEVLANRVFTVSAVTGNANLNGTFVASATSGIGASGVQYSCATGTSSGSTCSGGGNGTITSGILSIPNFFGGAGLYRLKGYAVCITCGISNTLTATLTCVDMSKTGQTSATSAATFAGTGNNSYFDIGCFAIGASPIQITLTNSVSAQQWSFSYYVEYLGG